MNHIPQELLDILKKRKDLIDLGFLEKHQERKLVVWIIVKGFIKYPEIFKGNYENNSILRWLTLNSSFNRFKNMPRIFLGIWDIHFSHKRRWPYPELNDFYLTWVEKNWKKFKLKLPEFENLFQKNINIFNKFEILIFDLFWIIRKPFSIKSSKYFGITIDLFFADKFKGWGIQLNVINSLIYRELKTRVSLVRGGILGVFVEPLGTIIFFLIIFSIFRGNNFPIDILLFLGSGIVLYTLFVNIAIRSSNSMKANEALFFYQPVKPVDTVIARTNVESGLFGIVFIVVILGSFLIRQEVFIHSLSLLFFTYLALVIFSFGIGLFLMVSTFIYPSLQQCLPLILRPLFFLSGVFYSVTTMPQWIIPYVSWNPILQAIEITRSSFSLNYTLDKSIISITYLWFCAFLSLFIGLLVYTFNEKKLLTK